MLAIRFSFVCFYLAQPKNVCFTFVRFFFLFGSVNGYYELIYISLPVKIDMGSDHL